MDVRFFESASELRGWLAEHGEREKELWIGFFRRSAGRPGVTYPEALDAALCFGWIDGVRRGIDATSYTMRFSPRRPRSVWSQVNIRRAEELARLGLMRPAGQKAFNDRDRERSGQSIETRPSRLDDLYEERFRASEEAWAFFQGQAPSYRRTVSGWVMGAKREETRLRRLAVLIEASAAGRRLDLLSPGAGRDKS